VFDRGEQAGQSGGKEIRQEAERSAALRAVPPSDPQPSRRRPGVTAMTGKRAAARRVQGAAGQSRVAPFAVPDVPLDARQSSQRKLHRSSPAHRRVAPRKRELSGLRRPSPPANAAPPARHSR
jgi:hypothetical protein